MSESKYLIQGSTLTAIANALRVQGGCFDNLKPSQMTSYIQNKLMSYGVFDAIISDPTISSATGTTINSSLLLNTSNSRAYMIKDTTLTSIANALRDKGAFSDTMTAAQMPSYIQNKIVSQGLINDFYNKTLSEIHNYTATTIGATAFQDCVSLHTVEFTECTTVGSSAFKNCTILSNLSLPKATTVNTSAFVNCKSVASLTIGLTNISSNTVTGPMTYSNPNLEYVTLPNCIAISGSTFQNCTKLSYVSAPSVQALYSHAFQGCTGLKEIELPLLGEDANNYKVGQQAFQGCTSLEKASFACVRGMNANAFSGCTSLKEFYAPCLSSNGDTPFKGVTTLEKVTTGYTTIPAIFSGQKNLIYFSDSNATALAENVFNGCTNLNENNIHLPNLTTIGTNYTFANTGFVNLTSNLFPKFASAISHYTFQGCTSLESINWPGPTYLGRDVFGNCTSLTYLSMPNVSSVYTNSNYTPTSRTANLTFINFNGLTIVPYNLVTGKTALTTAYINGATTINQSAFLGCTALKSVYMKGVTTLNAYAFANCTALDYVETSSLVNITTNYVFQNTGFTNVTNAMFPNLQSISHYCFSSCANLTSVDLSNVTYLGRAAFGNCPELIYVSTPKVNSMYLSGTNTPLENSPNIVTVNFNSMATVPYGLLNGKTALTTAYFQGATTTTKSAFLGCTALNSVYLNSATTIGVDTFKNCTALTLNGCNFGTALSLINQTAFAGCTGITSITNTHFPSNSKITAFTVGIQAFTGCTNLSTISNSAFTALSKNAFQSCTALTTVNLPKLQTIADETVPFSGCTTLKTVSLAAVTTLGVYAFSNLTTLTSISVPNCTTLSNYALYNTGLISFYGPKVTYMNGYVFQNTPIVSISLPLCSYVGKYALSNSTLESISMPAWSSYHASGVFSAAITNTLKYLNIGLITIPRTYFSNCINLNTVIAKKCTTLASNQFTGCITLSSITLPLCATIGSSAFTGCTSLKSIEFPSATKISAQAFSGCTNLSTIKLINSTLCTLQNSNAFTDTQITSTTGSIFVPGTLLSNYQSAAQWSYFANRIYSMSQRFSLFGTTQTLTSDFMTWSDWDTLNNYNQAYTYKAGSYVSYYYIPKYSLIQYGISSYRWQQVGTMSFTKGSILLEKTSLPGTFMSSSIAAYYVGSGYTYKYSYYQFGKSTDTIVLGQNYLAGDATITSEMPTE